MITRIWHGRTSVENADGYLQFLLNNGTREYQSSSGNISVKVLQSLDKECCHFWTITEWTDIDAIKKFAGENPIRAVYYPEDEGVLLEFEDSVVHAYTFPVK